MIEVKNLNKTYDRRKPNANHVLKDVSFTLPDTGFVCILGPSGCGKTSLLNAIGGLDAFDNGTLATENVSVNRYGTPSFENERNRSFGYIFQNYYLLDNHSVAYNVYLGLHSLKLSHKEKLDRVNQALEAVDMQRYARRKVSDLSGGQQQRVAIARALARRPKVIFADEPTGNLDEANTQNICTLLRQASKDSLVLMVTHEERIARFFADRIITLDSGVLVNDTETWDREQLTLDNDKELYAGDFRENTLDASQLELRLLQSENAPPVKLTVVATADRIVLKLSDPRAVLLSQNDDSPKILEGKRPVLKLENLSENKEAHIPLFRDPPAQQAKAGKGVTAAMQLQEARSLMQGKGIRAIGMRIFLVLLTVLTLITAGDFIAVSRIRPEDFVTGDSHFLEVEVAKGKNTNMPGKGGLGFEDDKSLQREYFADLVKRLPDCQVLGQMSATPTFQVKMVYQMNDLKLNFPAHSTVSVKYLDESSLIFGRMPTNSREIVVDKLVLESIIAKEGILQNAVSSVEMFLDATLTYSHKPLTPTIVGISDSGERSVYMTEAAMLNLSLRGAEAISLTELQALHPGEFDDVVLADNECIAIIDNAGYIYTQRIDTFVSMGVKGSFLVKDAIYSDKTQSYFVVSDGAIAQLTLNIATDELFLYCPDKAAAKAVIRQRSQWEKDGELVVTINDRYQREYDQYLEQTLLRTDARIIITLTVMAICMVMLYLLCRAQIQHRLSLIAVYRLLGIPGRKLYGIFLMEGTLSALASVIPVGLLTWGVIAALQHFTELEIPLELSLPVTGLVCLCILIYYLIVSMLPLGKLLRLPPARLATQYDV